MFKRHRIPRIDAFVQNCSDDLWDILPKKGLHYHFLIARYSWNNPTMQAIADRYEVSTYRVSKDLRLAESLVLQHILQTETTNNHV